MGRWLELGRLRYPIILVILLGSALLASVAIWRSSTRSSAGRVWVYGAKVAVGLGWLVAGFVAAGVVAFRPDPETTSHTIQAELHPDPALPYIGFWKANCEDDFGLAIQRAAEGGYFVRFCSPGGCFGKTRFTRTTLVNDSKYRILDGDTIAVRMIPGRHRSLKDLSPEDRARIQKSIRGDLLIYRRCKWSSRHAMSRPTWRCSGLPDLAITRAARCARSARR
jgi:hypothetical protein